MLTDYDHNIQVVVRKCNAQIAKYIQQGTEYGVDRADALTALIETLTDKRDAYREQTAPVE